MLVGKYLPPWAGVGKSSNFNLNKPGRYDMLTVIVLVELAAWVAMGLK